MKYIFSIIFFVHLSVALCANSLSIENRVNEISSLIYQFPDSAYSSALQLMHDAKIEDNEYGIVQSNFILAFIHDEIHGEYGKAIIYYLEAIRFAEKSSYDGVTKNLISLHKNCGVIFRKFNSFELSTSYYNKALQYAYKINDIKQIVSLKYNLSGIYRDQHNYDLAISTLDEILKLSNEGSMKYFEILNRLSFTHYEKSNFQVAIDYANQLIESQCPYPKLTVYAFNTLGRVYMEEGLTEKADQKLNNALTILKSNPEEFNDAKAEFGILYDLGTNEIKKGDLNKAISYLNKAIDIIPNVTQNPEFYEIYKSLANINYELGNYTETKKFEDLYSKNLGNYLILQEEILETDKRYNMDLITKRYFDEVEKQERIASILFYSKLISGTLLMLLLLSVGYNWYQKTKLRRSIVRELIDLKIID